MPRFSGKIVIVIGGTSGIGLASAKLFAEQGARVLVTGHSKDAIADARRDLDGDVTVLESDATDSDDIAGLAEHISQNLKAIDLLFFNAGTTVMRPFSDVSADEYDKLMGLNARSPFFVVQELAPLIRDGGAIVVTTSVANVKGIVGNIVYSAAKAALRSMVRTWARELAPRKIRVNAVTPGPISTSILDKVMGKEAAEKARATMLENNPMKRFGHPDEVARAVAFLGFDATFTTGAELPVDGGASQL